ncbi:MAG: hypothetical protein Q9M91_04195 [Candidatus Dojkabacteria bacterium]|nr:hypothetical protein [Candidatus Dojkabacteria bacterium]MDQ7021015.1 hypothetical protein [Candidatus Dojkabacteria bacterium]
MSINEKTLEQLFVSKVRIKALRYFMTNPTISIHLRGAVREFDEEINAVRRELMRLETVGLIKVETKGNRKYFKLNINHSLVDELSNLIHKTFGLGGEITSQASKLGDIKFAFLTPSFTKGFQYGNQIIDLVLIGTVNMNDLNKIVKVQEDATGKEIHYTVISNTEFDLRKRRKDNFYTDLIEQSLVMLVGKQEDLIS